jgi:hypothetical protein
MNNSQTEYRLIIDKLDTLIGCITNDNERYVLTEIRDRYYKVLSTYDKKEASVFSATKKEIGIFNATVKRSIRCFFDFSCFKKLNDINIYCNKHSLEYDILENTNYSEFTKQKYELFYNTVSSCESCTDLHSKQDNIDTNNSITNSFITAAEDILLNMCNSSVFSEYLMSNYISILRRSGGCYGHDLLAKEALSAIKSEIYSEFFTQHKENLLSLELSGLFPKPKK